MLVTKLMLKNKFTGIGFNNDTVGEFVNGELNGIGVTSTQTGQFKKGKPAGYIINNYNNITHTNNNDTTQLVTLLDNGNTWIGDDFGILIRLDGSTSTGYKTEHCND